jgi:diketogulonate reductase-like aldo/keto reductase
MSAIALAFNAGFTHIDTAESYKNQVKGLGRALRATHCMGAPPYATIDVITSTRHTVLSAAHATFSKQVFEIHSIHSLSM